jgi:D-alanyl-D-alanine carboxypeptidase
MKRIGWLVFALAWLGSPLAPAQESALEGALRTKLAALLAQGFTPGATAGIALPDGRVLGVAAGSADRTAMKPMTPQAVLMQGSIGKTYAAAVALQLVHEKKLSLDDKVAKYLGAEPWFARLPNAADLTVRMLMNHTSGIMRYEYKRQFTDDLTKQPAKTWKPAELVAYVLDEKPRFAAGKGWEYSDTNYIVLGMIIEKVTGQPYYAELRRRVLDPLGLKQTYPTDRRTIPGLVQGYAGERNPFGGADEMLNDRGEMIINPQFEWTGGGLASTATDLARWAGLLYQGKAFDPSLLPLMLDGVSAPMLGREAKYGLGVILRPTALGPSYGHSGFFPGYQAEVMYWPEHKLAVAVQVNTSEGQKVRPRLVQWCVELAEAARRVATSHSGDHP